MSNQIKKMRRTVMRRVYTAFALSILKHPAMLHGMLLSVSVGVFARQVHVASLLENMLATQLGSLPSFILNAFMRGEVLTILAIGIMCMTLLSFRWQLVRSARLRTLATA